MELRSDADLQAIQTSVAFKNISDAVEQYRRQFGLAFLALVAFSAIHVGLVVIANLYTMQTKLHGGVLTDASDPSMPVTTGESKQAFDLQYIMTHLQDVEQLRALSEVRTASFVDPTGTYRQYTVTGFQIGGWKRSELKLYTSVGHVLQYVRGQGVQVYTESSAPTASCNCSAAHSQRKLLGGGGTIAVVNIYSGATSYVPFPDFDENSTAEEIEAWNDMYYAANYGTSLGDQAKADYVTRQVNKLDETADLLGRWSAGRVNYAAGTGWTGYDMSERAWKTTVKHAVARNYGWGLTSAGANAYEHNAASWKAGAGAREDAYEAAVGAAEEAASTYAGEIAEAESAYSDWVADNDITLYDGKEFTGSAWKTFLLANNIYEGSGYEDYEAALSANGGYDNMVKNVVNEVIVDIVRSAHVYVDSWNSFTSTGFFGTDAIALEASSGYTVGGFPSGEYGCSGVAMSDIFEGDTIVHDTVINGKMVKGSISMFCETDAALLGGAFFSPVLGAHDSFIAHVTKSLLCAGGNPISAGDGGLHVIGVWYLYFLHGWGESSSILFEYDEMISSLMTTISAEADDSSVGRFVTFVVNDMACPYGGKTWYMNSFFTGYHMDMIVFDLPHYAENSFGFAALGKGLFGFSMGGFGSMSIVMTYPKIFFGAATFNAVLDADPCMHYGYCHTYCSVDAFACDLKWTTTHVAFLPYVTMKSGMYLSSVGAFDPVAYGVAMSGCNGNGACRCSESGAIILSGAVRVSELADSNMKLTNNNPSIPPHTIADATSTPRLGPGYGQVITSSATYPTTPFYAGGAVTFSNYFYLDPVEYTKHVSHFSPSFDPVSGEKVQASWDVYMFMQPLHRLITFNMLAHAPVFMLVASDSDDPYGLPEQANAIGAGVGLAGGDVDIYGFSSTLAMHSSGGFILDTSYSAGCGHCMDARDFTVAYMFFADIFDSWTTCSTNSDETNGKINCFQACSGGDGPNCVRGSGSKAGRFLSNVGLEVESGPRKTAYLSVQNMQTSSVPAVNIDVTNTASVKGGVCSVSRISGTNRAKHMGECLSAGSLPPLTTALASATPAASASIDGKNTAAAASKGAIAEFEQELRAGKTAAGNGGL